MLEGLKEDQHDQSMVNKEENMARKIGEVREQAKAGHIIGT